MHDRRVTAMLAAMLMVASWFIIYMEYGADLTMDLSTVAMLLLTIGVLLLVMQFWHVQADSEHQQRTLQQRIDQLQSIAFEDKQTGLPNHLAFVEHVDKRLISHVGLSNGVLAIKIERYDYLLEVLGGEGLDELSQQVGSRLQELCGAEDFLARADKVDGFLVFHSAVNSEDLEALAGRIVSVMKAPFSFHSNAMMLTVAIGIGVQSEQGGCADLLVEHAQQAQRIAMQRGGDQWHLYHPHMENDDSERFYLHNALFNALANDELSVVYQPQVDAFNNTLSGFEALLRWHHPGMGSISPAEFIPLAEEIGLIGDLGRWLIGQVCKQQVEWKQQGLSLVPVAVNVSPLQISQGDLVDDLENQLARWNLAPKYLEIEVTESCVMDDFENAIATLKEIREIGIDIAIDDFGTGYSSLNYLKRLPGHKVKIDRAFVQEMHEDSDDQAIVQAVISISSQLGMQVLAEGVETDQQKDLLMHLGCNLMQGYLYSKPLAAADCMPWLTGQALLES